MKKSCIKGFLRSENPPGTHLSEQYLHLILKISWKVETSSTDVLKQSFNKICPLCKKNIDNLPIERLCVCQQLLSIRSSFRKKGTVLKTDSIDLTNYVKSPQKGS